MKKLLIFTVALSASLLSHADPIGSSKALQIAQRTLGQQVEQVALTDGPQRLRGVDGKQPAYYLFNATSGKGFAIVSGDDRFDALMAYSADGHLNTEASLMPDALRLLLSSYSDAVEAVREGRADAPEMNYADPNPRIIVAPMVKCQWGQDTPYNNLTPVASNGQHCVTGCTATAMSQIMYKWKWPERGMGTLTYNNGYTSDPVDFTQSVYQWDLMRDTYEPRDNGTPAGNAVAKLMADAGHAAHMMYTSSASGTYVGSNYRAFVEHFRYKASTADYVYRDCYSTQDEWNQMLMRELRHGRPVLMGAQARTGSGRDAAGHDFVLDGYDSNEYIHVNWGWDGVYDGYYAPQLMNNPQYEFSLKQGVAMGLEPDRTGTDNKFKGTKLTIYSAPTTTSTRVNAEKIFTIQVRDTIRNRRPWDFDGEIGIGLYDKEDNFIGNVAYNKRAYTLKSYYYNVQTIGIPCMFKKSTGLVPTKEGDYYLAIVFKDATTGNEIWQKPEFVRPEGRENRIWVYYHDGAFYFNQVSTGIGSVESDGADVESTRYFDLSGRELKEPTTGQIYIQRETLSNGRVRSTKGIAR